MGRHGTPSRRHREPPCGRPRSFIASPERRRVPLTSILGQAYVQIRPATSGFGAELTRSLNSPLRSAAGLATKILGTISVAAAVKSVATLGMKYEDTLNNLQAVSKATAAQMAEVSKTAKQLGSDTSLTATSAADAAVDVTELAKGGLSVDEAMKAARGTLQLAAAAGVDAAEAASLQSAALNAFNLDADQAGRVADVLANAANAAAGEITDFGQALQQGGAVAAATGISLEDTAAALGLLANNGIKGSDAGTLLKSALLALQSPSTQAQKAMGALNLSAYDASGNFVGLSSIFDQLSDAQKRMTPQAYAAATSTLFGSDAARLAGVAGREGAEGFDAMAEAMRQEGTAAEVAEAKSKGLHGAFEALQSQFETVAIDLYEQVSPALEGVVRAFAEIVGVAGKVLGFFNDLPGPVKLAVTALGGIALLKKPISSAFETIALKALYAKDAFAGASFSMGGLKKAGSGLLSFFGGPWGLAITGATVGLSLLVDWLGKSDNATSDLTAAQTTLTDAIKATNGAIDESVRRAAAEALQKEHLLDFAEVYGIQTQDMVGYVLGEADARGRVIQAIDRQIAAVKGQLTGDKDADIVTQAVIDSLEGRKASLDALAGSTESTVAKEKQLAEATGQTGGAMAASTQLTEEATAARERWIAQLSSVNAAFVEPLSVYQDIVQQHAQATADATKSSKDSWQDYAASTKVSLDEVATKLQEQITAQENWRSNLVTIAGRGGAELAQILAGMGEQGATLVQQMVDANAEDFARMRDLMIRDARLGGDGASDELDDAMKIMEAVGSDGAHRTAAGVAYQLGLGVDDVARISSQYGIKLADGVNPLLAALGQRTVSIIQRGSRPNSGSLDRPGFAYGGEIPGASPHDRADNVPIWATAGEFMQPRPAVRKYGLGFMESVRTGQFPAAIARRYADGGFVFESDVPRPPSTAPYRHPISTAGDAAMDTEYRATVDFVRENGVFGRALAWAKSQVGKPYIWGGVGPDGYDCSGFMSALTNIIRGGSPYARVGTTATFPWPGFAPGSGPFTIGSVANAGGGVGHMAGSLLGVNVESAGGVGVRVGGSARGANDPLFSTRAHLVYDRGGVLEPGMTLADNRSTKPEAVLTNDQWAAIERLANGGGLLDGVEVTGRLEIGGDGLARIVDGRITAHNEKAKRDLRRYR